jgi:hypothetical protein
MSNIKLDENSRQTVAGVSTLDSSPVNIFADPVTQRLYVDTKISSGFGLPAYDYVSQTQDTLTDTWVFKTGGVGGTTVATITITYTGTDKLVISNVAKT